MTAYSYTDWTAKTADEQKANPGVSIERTHVVNNPDRGVYWSPSTAASALSRHIETTLAGEDRLAAQRMWNGLRQLHRQATESPRMTDRAMQGRQSDAHNALGAYNGNLEDNQLDQLMSAFDDVARLQKVAVQEGVDPVEASRRMLNRAAARAVGYDIDDRDIDAEMRPLVNNPEGAQQISNLNQSVAQLQLLLKGRSLDTLDALDQIDQIGRDTDLTDETRDDHRRLTDILSSIPLVLNPNDIEREQNFSVRMETQEEATLMETAVRWAGEQERMPEPREVHRAFASWRDNGLADSPYSYDKEPALAIVLGNTDSARDNVADLIRGLDGNKRSADAPIIVLTVGADDRMRDALGSSGRTVVDVTAEADANGTHLSSRDQKLPGNRVELVNLTVDQANDPIERSLAVNAVIGRADAVGYVEGHRMTPVEGQAIHLAGTLRKLQLGMDAQGNNMKPERLRDLRQTAREVDIENDAQRYFTAGHARPHRGVNAVAFESANMYDLANKANAPGRDLIGEAYASIPKDRAILMVDNPKNAANKWMRENMTDRNVLYAEATRTLSFAQMTGVGLEGETRTAREAGMELKIYDRPASQREYGFEEQKSRITNPDIKEYRPKNGVAPENTPGVRKVCLTESISWDDPRVRKALIMVSGNANTTAINGSAQAIKVAQEAVMDHAHSALILTDQSPTRQSQDMPSSTMIRLATEMGKKATVIDGTGREIPLHEAREKTFDVSENFSQKLDREVSEKMTAVPGNGRNSSIDVAAKEDLGQLALAALPGMDAARAIQFAHTDVTLKEIRTDKSEEMRKQLYQLGMPAETRKVINDIEPWTKAMDRAIANMKAADDLGAKLYVPTDITHPIEQASGNRSKHAVFAIGEYDFEKQPVAAFIGNSERFREPGATMSLSEEQKAGKGAQRGAMVDPADAIDRADLRRTIEQMANKGYGIGVTLEQGISRAVLEEAARVPDAKVVIAASGNVKAASPELRTAMLTLLEQDRAAVLMPANIAAHSSPDPRNGEERKPEVYVDDRAAMQDMLAATAKVGIVVASGDRDQSMHVVKKMIDQEKPIAVMVSQDPNMAGSDLYSANARMMSGPGKTFIQSRSLAQAPSANAYAEINDQETAVTLVDGVRRGNAGTFQSAKLLQMPMARSGRHNLEMGWGSAAHTISGEASIDRFVQKVERGEGALGQYRQPTERELERARLDREIRRGMMTDSAVSRFVQEEFGQTSALHRSAIDKDAGRAVETMGLDDQTFGQRQAERNAVRQAAAAGQSMN